MTRCPPRSTAPSDADSRASFKNYMTTILNIGFKIWLDNRVHETMATSCARVSLHRNTAKSALRCILTLASTATCHWRPEKQTTPFPDDQSRPSTELKNMHTKNFTASSLRQAMSRLHDAYWRVFRLHRLPSQQRLLGIHNPARPIPVSVFPDASLIRNRAQS